MQLPESSDSLNSIFSIGASLRSAHVASDFLCGFSIIPRMPLAAGAPGCPKWSVWFFVSTRLVFCGKVRRPASHGRGVEVALCSTRRRVCGLARQKRNVSPVKLCWRFCGAYYVRVTAYWKSCVVFPALRCAISVRALLYALLCTKHSVYSKNRGLSQSFPDALKTTEVGYILHIVSIITAAPPFAEASQTLRPKRRVCTCLLFGVSFPLKCR